MFFRKKDDKRSVENNADNANNIVGDKISDDVKDSAARKLEMMTFIMDTIKGDSKDAQGRIVGDQVMKKLTIFTGIACSRAVGEKRGKLMVEQGLIVGGPFYLVKDAGFAEFQQGTFLKEVFFEGDCSIWKRCVDIYNQKGKKINVTQDEIYDNNLERSGNKDLKLWNNEIEAEVQVEPFLNGIAMIYKIFSMRYKGLSFQDMYEAFVLALMVAHKDFAEMVPESMDLFALSMDTAMYYASRIYSKEDVKSKQ